MIQFGKVEDLIDPLKLGRVKVRVLGFHDNRDNGAYRIETKDLAWSQVLMPSNSPSVNGKGSSVNLLVGSLVAGEFLDSAMQEFIVMGSLPTKTAGVEDNNVRVREEADPNADEPKGTYEPEVSTYAPKYPYNNVMETESGHVKEYDDTPGNERITERHKSGTQYEVSPNGSKVERIVRDNYRLVVGHDTLEVYGNVQIIVSGHVDLAVAGNITTSVTGNMSASVGGNMESNVTGSMTASVQGATSLRGVDEDNNKLLSIDFDNDAKKITLDSLDVEITGKLKVLGTTTTGGSLVLDTHVHAGDGGTGSGINTGGPAAAAL